VKEQLKEIKMELGLASDETEKVQGVGGGVELVRKAFEEEI
jgi:hypothetical protein